MNKFNYFYQASIFSQLSSINLPPPHKSGTIKVVNAFPGSAPCEYAVWPGPRLVQPGLWEDLSTMVWLTVRLLSEAKTDIRKVTRTASILEN